MNKFITAKEIVKKYGISYQKINRYTDACLLDVISKQGNMRLYDIGQVHKRLKSIEAFAKEGYSLRFIRKKLVGI